MFFFFFTEFKVDVNPINDVAKLMILDLFLDVWRPPAVMEGTAPPNLKLSLLRFHQP